MSELASAATGALARLPRPSGYDLVNLVVAAALAKACGVI